MNAGEPNESDLQARLDENDPVWRLLGQAPRPEPDAWFTVRTLARCRNEDLSPEPRGLAWSRIWHWALSGGLGVCLTMVLVISHVHNTAVQAVAANTKANVQEAFEIMASLDSNPASDSDSSWQDSSM